MNTPRENTWLTAAEIAAATLPDFPITKRGINKIANRENWVSRPRLGRGGGKEYNITSLPVKAQKALIKQGLVRVRPEIAAQEIPEQEIPEQERPAQEIAAQERSVPLVCGDLSDWQRAAMEARLILLDYVNRLCLEFGRRGVAEAYLVAQAEKAALPAEIQGQITRANVKSGTSRILSTQTLQGWRRAFAKYGALGLAPTPPRRAGQAPDWLAGFLPYYLRPTKPSLAHAYEMWERANPALALPPVRTVYKHINKMGAITKNRGRMGPRELKTIRAYMVRTTDNLQPTDVYTADGHCADFEVLHPIHGRPFRPEIVSILDVKTRLCVGWSAGLAESAWLVADALRLACARGVPGIFYVDRGAGFKNKILGQESPVGQSLIDQGLGDKNLDDPILGAGSLGTEATGILGRIGTEIHYALPYNSQARGLIERFHQSCWIRAGKELPTFVGADMDRQARQVAFKRSRREMLERGRSSLHMSWSEFLEWGAAQVALYNARSHSGLAKLGSGHQSPDQAWAAAVDAGWEPEILAAEEAEDLFRPYEVRQVNRGAISIFGYRYADAALEQQDLHGRSVRVGYDIHDPSQVWIRDEQGYLLCTARLDAGVAEYFPHSAVKRAQDKRAEGRLKRLEVKVQEIRAEAGPKILHLEQGSASEMLPVLNALETEQRHHNADRAQQSADRSWTTEEIFGYSAQRKAL